jgi:hypothetical protein
MPRWNNTGSTHANTLLVTPGNPFLADRKAIICVPVQKKAPHNRGMMESRGINIYIPKGTALGRNPYPAVDNIQF